MFVQVYAIERVSPMKHWVGVIAFLFGAVGPVYSYQSVDYLRDVKPVFASNCYGCHGAKVQMAGLRLDTGAAILKGSMSGPVVVPGSSAESKLIRAVTGAEGAVRMPFKKPPLKEEEIARIKAWVDQGAKVSEAELAEDGRGAQTHWAFLPPVRPALPEIDNPQWVRNEIDRFVLARLEKEGIAPSPEADRRTLIRRLSFDLIGLPPTPEQADAFLADKAANAYETVVDRLLASKHFGERMAVPWLDAVRYADSYGYQSDQLCPTWPYRDWVVAAFNDNMPYDRFLTEQLAGDLLPQATRQQRLATAFNRLHRQTNEGGSIEEEWRTEYVSDRVQTFSTACLG